MNEIDKLKRAKLYMDKLANGIDPNSGNRVHVDDIVRDSALSLASSIFPAFLAGR
jgi:hypothetical protein